MEISPPLAAGVVHFTAEADVVVVGLGCAGACAALEAREAGAEVIVVERTSGGGGSSAMAGGYIYLGGGTRVQKANGFDDTVEEMFKYIMAVTPDPDPVKVRAYCEGSVAHFDWLERHGVPFNTGFFQGKHPGHLTDDTLSWTGSEEAWPYNEIARPAPRGHKAAAPGHAAHAMMKGLIEAVHAAGIRVEADALVNALIRDEAGRVVGVRFRRFGEEACVKARKAVVLTTGGYVWNREMIERYTPLMALEGVGPHGAPTSDGSGIQLGTTVGGALMNMQGCMITYPIYPPEERLYGILVNRNGERFINEDVYHGRATAFMMRQPDLVTYLICDAVAFGERTGYEPLVDAWESVAEMERDLSMPEGALQATLARYNEAAARGEDPAFHKAAKYVRPLVEPPFAALEYTLGKTVRPEGLTQGGLKTTVDAQVLDAAGRPIPGLYAAGATASNIAKDSAGYASGFMIGESTFFGRRAGAHAARSAAA